jgi:hypothetical protein
LGVRPLGRHRKAALAASHEQLHIGEMADKSAVAIIGIAIFVIVGGIVAVGILGNILMFLYGIVVLVFRCIWNRAVAPILEGPCRF